MDRSFRQFDVLDDVKVAGGSQPKSFDFVVIDFVFDRFVNAVGRQWLAQLSLVSRLSTSSRFLAASRSSLGLGLVISLEGGLEKSTNPSWPWPVPAQVPLIRASLLLPTAPLDRQSRPAVLQ